jgi:cysteine desulfurase
MRRSVKHNPQFQSKHQTLRDKLYDSIREGLSQEMVKLNGHPQRRLPNTLNISIKNVVGEELLSQMPEIAASTGSACHAGSTEPSEVLLAMGLTREQAVGALRFSLGRWSTREEIDEASHLTVHNVQSKRPPRP